jgi:hypothetical protein
LIGIRKMSKDVKSKVDILKTRLIPFIKETDSHLELKIPNRVMIGFKLDIVAVIIKDLLYEKYNKNLQLIIYDKYGDNDYVFKYKEI